MNKQFSVNEILADSNEKTRAWHSIFGWVKDLSWLMLAPFAVWTKIFSVNADTCARNRCGITNRIQDQERFGQLFRPVITGCFLLSKNIQAKTHFGKSYSSLIGHMILHVRVIILRS
ncbi:MAG TPA: hypothetical protein DD635_07095 [Flavobacteriales bacterium]|nr:hypothetical protein [Flavobacteriales bacterium]